MAHHHQSRLSSKSGPNNDCTENVVGDVVIVAVDITFT